MNVSEFHKAALDALAVEPNEDDLIDLSNQAQELADMVSWAPGAIDTDGRVNEAFVFLQNKAKAKYEATNDNNVAGLHDAVGDLIVAIIKHDEDFDTSSNDDNEDNNIDM